MVVSIELVDSHTYLLSGVLGSTVVQARVEGGAALLPDAIDSLVAQVHDSDPLVN